MRVCFFIPRLDGGGAELQCIALLNVLQHNPAIDVHLILLGHGDIEDGLDVSGLTVHRIHLRNFAHPRAPVFVATTLHRVRPDVLISWLHPADIWSYAATRVIRGVPWIITEGGSAYPDEIRYMVRSRVGRRAAAAIIANSRGGRQLWESVAPCAPVRLIPNMALGLELPAGVERESSVECLYVGRLEPVKNTVCMTTAFASFAAAHLQARLTIAGKGSRADEIAEIARRSGIASRVELVGFRRDVPTLMSRARVLLAFSLHEGMPNVLMESVAAGLPAVVSDIPGHRELLGSEYPYYVGLDAPPQEAALVIATAWAGGLATATQIYAHARGVLASMTPENVAAAYVDAFAEVIARTARPATTMGRMRRPRRFLRPNRH